MKKRICVYTAITGNYDTLRDVNIEEGVDYFCFTNNRNITSKTWTIKYIDDEGLDNITLARKQKIIMNDYLQDNYDITVWIDGATYIRGSIKEFIDQECKLDQFDMTVFKHSVRNSVFDEAVSIVKFRKESIKKVQDTICFLKDNNYHDDQGLTETTVLVRKTKNDKVNETMKLWFDLLSKYTIRDQLTFDYSVYTIKPKIRYLNYNVFDNIYFGWITHNKLFDFDNSRVYFGEYIDIFDDNILDVKNESESQVKYQFTVKNDCDFIELWSGQNKDTLITDFNIEGCQEFKTNCIFNINNQMLLGDDPLVIRLDKKFKQGESIEISFFLNKLNMESYRKLLISHNQIFTEIINSKNQQINALENQTFIQRIKKRGI